MIPLFGPNTMKFDRTSRFGKGYISAPSAFESDSEMPSASKAVPFSIETRRSIWFLNFAHALDHYVMLIFPTVVIALEAVYAAAL